MESPHGPADVVEHERLNDKRRINKFLESVNRSLPVGGRFIGRVECAHLRKSRFLANYPGAIRWPLYSVDYLVHRVWPKLPYVRASYFALTKGRGRVMAEMEAIGRLYACGFKVVDTRIEGTEMHFVAEKTGEPAYDMEATYGPLITLRRVGRGGNVIRVYKFRTMAPYSEYIQGYIYERNGYDGGSGFRDDTRITTVGHFMRKYWIDELPMLWNLCNGGLKIFGVRPVSRHYMELFPEEFKTYRKRFKPGLVPPVYVEVPRSFDDISRIEREYLEQYEASPLRTDLRYLWLAVYNILIRRVRSA